MNATHLPPEALETWLAAVSEELGLQDADVPIGRILKFAADVAHGVARPAAPLTTFLLGLALGRSDAGAVGGEDAGLAGGSGSPASAPIDALIAQVSAIVESWEPGA